MVLAMPEVRSTDLLPGCVPDSRSKYMATIPPAWFGCIYTMLGGPFRILSRITKLVTTILFLTATGLLLSNWRKWYLRPTVRELALNALAVPKFLLTCGSTYQNSKLISQD